MAGRVWQNRQVHLMVARKKRKRIERCLRQDIAPKDKPR
jgi:hypothetical protein